MKRSKTSKQWMREHVNDVYVQRAKSEGYRSRAAYKLLEIAARDRLLKPGMVVVDLGAAPGGWSQVARTQVGVRGLIVALDLLDMAPLPGVKFLQGDFSEDDVVRALGAVLAGRKIDLVLSDMSPNISGIAVSDQVRAMHLAQLALEFAVKNLKPGGSLLVKVFQGSGFEEFLRQMRTQFKSVVTRKPEASRGRSSELYLLGKGHAGGAGSEGLNAASIRAG
jgi:23S rRNA (uridine2552-2'-O)-methyltransferase